jgi:hypothetical protein
MRLWTVVAMLAWEFKVTKKEYVTSSPSGSPRDDLQ